MKYLGVNGVPTPESEAVISVMDHGFMYGMGLFETFRTYGGHPFLLEKHLNRIRSACRALGIRYYGEEGPIRSEIMELLKLNGLSDGYIRLTVSAGIGPLGLSAEDYSEPNVVIYVKPLPDSEAQLYLRGKALLRLQTRRNTPEGDIRHKSLHYMNNILAKRELAEYERNVARPTGHGYVGPIEGMLLTAEGYLAEGIVSNLFFVKDDKLHTPDIKTGILPGITREWVLESANLHGLSWEQGCYTWDRLLDADEVFTTNSIQEIIPITLLIEPKAGHLTVGTGTVGPITQMLLDNYRERAGR